MSPGFKSTNKKVQGFSNSENRFNWPVGLYPTCPLFYKYLSGYGVPASGYKMTETEPLNIGWSPKAPDAAISLSSQCVCLSLSISIVQAPGNG